MCLLCIPLVNVHSEWDGQFIDVQDFLVIVNDDDVWLEVDDAQVSRNLVLVSSRIILFCDLQVCQLSGNSKSFDHFCNLDCSGLSLHFRSFCTHRVVVVLKRN